MGTLFVVATPIGNLEDISARALRVLSTVNIIAAEDTRHTKKLLDRFDIQTPMLSYHAFNEQARIQRLLAELASGDVALVSDAGTPAISDPGQILVSAAIAAGFPVSPIPGPSALAAAVSVSGLIAGPFVFAGFLPRTRGDRLKVLGSAASTGFGLVVYEAPGRVAPTLRDLLNVLGDRRAVVCREITKLHETMLSGTLESLVGELADRNIRGEIVIVVAGGAPVPENEDDAEEVITRLIATGAKLSDIAKDAAASTGRPRSEMYQLARTIGDRQKQAE